MAVVGSSGVVVMVSSVVSGAGPRRTTSHDGHQNGPATRPEPIAAEGALGRACTDHVDDGVRINAVCSGIIDTPMMDRVTGGTDDGCDRMVGQEPVGRMGRPEEAASAVLWLCSDLGAFTIGHALVIDGGRTVD